ncbi:MAG: ATP-binding protein [Candidatus Binatia bacterium]
MAPFSISDVAARDTPEVRAALDQLVIRRARLLLMLGFAATVAFAAVNHLASAAAPLWTDMMNGAIVGLLAIALGLGKLPAVRRHTIAVTVLLVGLGCAVRAWAGVWHGDVAPTAIILAVLAMTNAAILPWGFWPQLAVAVMAGLATAANSYLVTGGFGPPPGHASASVALGLAGSVILAIEMRRHHLQLFVDNFKRQQAEAALARLNAELEGRVEQRTAELAAATRNLEREAQERRQAERELRESQRRLQAVLDHADVAIYLRDLEGRYIVVNRYFLALAGRSLDEVIGHTMEEVLPLDVVAALRAHDALVLATPHSVQIEESIPQVDGWHTFVSVKFAWLDGAGTPVGIWGLSTDITDRKHAEQAAREHQAELAHVLRLSTMGEMASGLAHEINQPLGAIANFAQGCVRRLRAGAMDNASLLPIIEQISAEALRAGEVIRRLRDVVRKDGPHQAPADVNHLVRESLRLIESEAQERGVAIRLELGAALPVVPCNDIQVEQVLLNLLLNGVEAVEATGGPVREVVVTTAATPDGVQVAVCDSGAGIPAPPADVFEPFYSTKAEGLGMGLSISRSIIEAHGGRIWAARNAERGSTFRFTLPGAVGEDARSALVDHSQEGAATK